MPESSDPQRDVFRAWLHELRGLAMRSPFQPRARVNVGVTPAAGRRILEALRSDEVTTRSVDCAGRPTERLLLDGVTIEWLARDGRGG
jgi:hypothetical protein